MGTEMHYGKMAAQEDLTKSIARWTDQGEQYTTAVPGLALFGRREPTEPMTGMYEPSICLVAQGAKRVRLGEVSQLMADSHLPPPRT